ncbi:EPIDERMAL PATTERNING FACTOR-like protein 2 [Zea mays]|uniref:Epidermal patterning factor-like protein n=2 Tax=Zea mays TaxID=4577 RepID=B6SNH7_MAIZE|nr:hypothetical protein [Zea mays]ACG36402.1 hypothetical protein [Zea mays]PWZ22446.1 EPIDERMAL PATTERNING FACTOR-like protein 2 [Zea mays]
MGHLFLLLVALLLLTSTRAAAAVHARASVIEEASFAGIRGVIGSRPPTCEGRCRSCGHCEAVQVPVSPQQLQRRKKEGLGLGRAAAAAATGGRARAMPASYYDHSNYKPLSWRCKCGRHILDP